MIAKPRFLPMRIHVNQALARRLPKNHPIIPILENSTSKINSGYHGEVEVDFHLKYLDDKEHHIFRDLRLSHPLHHFQLDNLILSRKYILHLEVKNYTGTLYFDEKLKQFYQTANNAEKGYQHPLTQLRRQNAQFLDWLAARGFSGLPVISQLVFSNPAAVIKTNDAGIRRLVCKADQLKAQLSTVLSSASVDIMTEKEQRKLSRLLLKENLPHKPEVLKNYDIHYDELRKGIQCPACSAFYMKRKHRFWVCPHCHHHSSHAHVDALLDYFLLVKPTITNSEFRDFMCLSSVKTSSNLLVSMGLPHQGINKGRVYFAPLNFHSLLEERRIQVRNHPINR
ncbi:nuclease-related domain-containing protein [Mesobacillus zeae]|nr:nuclease-related domain-containing protein [Mesobacillus zeae]